jgi:hypothetical protein
VAALGIQRAEVALRRYLTLRPVVTSRQIPGRATRYVTEVINTYAFGFDAACIALCRATLEQCLREELVQRGVYTEPQLKREQPTAGTLMEKSKQAGILVNSAAAARRLVKKGNTVMHQFLYDEKISAQQAVDSIAELLEALRELLADKRDGTPA